MNKKLAICFISGMLLYLLTFWTSGISVFLAGWVQSLAFFALTYFLLMKFAEPKSYGTSYAVAVVLGRLLLEIPIRIYEFPETLYSVVVTITVLFAVVLAAVNFSEKRVSVFVLSAVFIALMNTIVHSEFYHTMRHDYEYQLKMSRKSRVILAKDPTATTGHLGIEDNKFEFGFVRKDEQKTIRCPFVLINTGSKPVVIQKVDVSCGGITVTDYPKVIAPGESKTLYADVHTESQSGFFNKVIYIKSNADNNLEILQIKGEIQE